MKLYVVRHAHAGSRSAWRGDDRLRPLSKKGWRQAESIADELDDGGITALLSSPYIRCIETLRPLADRLSLGVDSDDRLGEGHDGAGALSRIEQLRKDGEAGVAICSHGDVIPDLLTDLKVGGTTFHDPLTWPKGSTWVVSHDGKRWADARYVGPRS